MPDSVVVREVYNRQKFDIVRIYQAQLSKYPYPQTRIIRVYTRLCVSDALLVNHNHACGSWVDHFSPS